MRTPTEILSDLRNTSETDWPVEAAEAKEVIELIESLMKGLAAVAELIDNSAGVAGLHLNGDVAYWQHIRAGGYFEAWLVDFDAALSKLPEQMEGGIADE